jgi:hypothetical protein
MRKVFPSAIGWIMIVPLIILLGVVLLMLFLEPRKWQALIVVVPIAIFIVHLLMTTDYTIDGTQLRIRCGFFKTAPIDITLIQSIAETNNPLSSPALSLDRLLIRYAERRQVMISPKDKVAFIDAIREVNPAVVVRIKNIGS